MKRQCLWGLLLLLLAVLAGCAFRDQDSVRFYYPRAEIAYTDDTGVIAGEARTAGGHTGDLQYLLSLYLSGPADSGLRSPFPPGVRLEECHVTDGQAEVLLSPGLDGLTPLERTIACVCLARTVLELTQADSVRIATTQGLLSGENAAVYDRDSVLLKDDVLSAPAS